MAEGVLTNAAIIIGAHNLSGDANALALNFEAEILDITKFGDDARRKIAGLRSNTFSLAGHWNGGDEALDDALFSKIALAGQPISFGGAGLADGARCFTAKALLGSYAPGAQVGEVFAFDAAGEADDDLGRGLVVANATAGSSSSSTGQQVGAIASGASLIANLHVTAASGSSPTLDVVLESDDNSGFTSATTRGTFSQATGLTAEQLTVAGPVTDDYWRVTYTIGGSTPSFSFVVALGISN